MSDYVLLEKKELPNESVVKLRLKNTYNILSEIRDYIKLNIGETIEEWKYYGKKNGWLLKVLIVKRNLFFICICNGYFILSFTFGEKAIKNISGSEISDTINNSLNKAKKYAEGKSILIEVKNMDTIKDIKELIRIKTETQKY